MPSVSVLDVLWRMSLVLTCPLCHNLLSRPSTLPCAHHLCRECLRQYSVASGAAGAGSAGMGPSGAAGLASSAGSGECVCPVDGCRRPFWSRECNSDNKQLHNLGQAFTAMRDAILAIDGSYQCQFQSQYQWPNQKALPADSSDDSDGDSAATSRATKKRGRHGSPRRKGRKPALTAHSRTALRGAPRTEPQPLDDDDDDDEKEEEPDKEEGESCAAADEDERDDEEEAGEGWSGGDEELIGDGEARLRMRSRMRRGQKQPTKAHSAEAQAEGRTAEQKAPQSSTGSHSAADRDSQRAQLDRSEPVCPHKPHRAALRTDGDGGAVPEQTATAQTTDRDERSDPLNGGVHAADGVSRAAAQARSPSSSSAAPIERLLASAAAPAPSARVLVLSSASRSHTRSALLAVEQLGTASVVPSSSEWLGGISHVVCCHASGDRLVKRTMKYMMGVLSGCWVVELAWLTDSAAAGYWLPEDTYEIKGDSIAGATQAPRRARKEREERERAEALRPPAAAVLPASSGCSVLAGCYFCVLEPLSSQCPSVHDLTQLIQLAGGHLLLPTLNIGLSSAAAAATGEAAVADWVEAVQRQLPAAFHASRRLALLCRPSLLEAAEAGECLPLSALQPLTRLPAVQLLTLSWLLDSIGAFSRLALDSGSSSIYSLTHLLPQRALAG